jgi:hypothetical protein
MSVPKLFAPWFDSLAPGMGDQTRVVTEQILYRSARRPASPAEKRREADGMDVERSDDSARPSVGRRAAGREEMALGLLDRPSRRQREPEGGSREGLADDESNEQLERLAALERLS